MHAFRRWTGALLAAGVVSGAACSSASQRAAETSDAAVAPAPQPGQYPGGRTADSVPRTDPSMVPSLPVVGTGTGSGDAQVARLEREARAIARINGCSSAAACRSAPVGARACGGPRTYVVYCAATTDTLALMRKLRELEAAEKELIRTSGMMSTCEFRTPPTTVLAGGSCREGSPER